MFVDIKDGKIEVSNSKISLAEIAETDKILLDFDYAIDADTLYADKMFEIDQQELIWFYQDEDGPNQTELYSTWYLRGLPRKMEVCGNMQYSPIGAYVLKNNKLFLVKS